MAERKRFFFFQLSFFGNIHSCTCFIPMGLGFFFGMVGALIAVRVGRLLSLSDLLMQFLSLLPLCLPRVSFNYCPSHPLPPSPPPVLFSANTFAQPTRTDGIGEFVTNSLSHRHSFSVLAVLYVRTRMGRREGKGREGKGRWKGRHSFPTHRKGGGGRGDCQCVNKQDH